MKYNCVISLKTISGEATDKKQGTAVTGVNALILPTSNDVLMMYPELPVGNTFSYLILGSTVIKPETELKITSSINGELTVNDIFIVSGVCKINKIGGQFYRSGVCVKKLL